MAADKERTALVTGATDGVGRVVAARARADRAGACWCMAAIAGAARRWCSEIEKAGGKRHLPGRRPCVAGRGAPPGRRGEAADRTGSTS